MLHKNPYYLHFVTDIQRVVFCIKHHDDEGAKIFLVHAHKIFEEKLNSVIDEESKELHINTLWLDLYHTKFPQIPKTQDHYCEKLLSLSSIIFTRSYQE